MHIVVLCYSWRSQLRTGTRHSVLLQEQCTQAFAASARSEVNTTLCVLGCGYVFVCGCVVVLCVCCSIRPAEMISAHKSHLIIFCGASPLPMVQTTRLEAGGRYGRRRCRLILIMLSHLCKHVCGCVGVWVWGGVWGGWGCVSIVW